MYTKEQLEQMEIAQLMGIAQELGIKVSQDETLENVIYAILDKAAEQSASGDSQAKRKRTRIVKKDTDRVYTVNGNEGENFDVKSRGKKSAEAPSLFSDVPVEAPAEATTTVEAPAEETEEKKPAPKKRGRKSKAELAAIAAEAAAKEAQVQKEENEPEQPVASEEIIPEAADFAQPVDDGETTSPEMLEQLQEHLSQHNQEEAIVQANPEGVWEDDPNDGTDFIIVEDLPIEDQGAIPTLDMFDRPVIQHVLALDEKNVPHGDGINDAVEHGLGEGLKPISHPLERLLIPHYGEEFFLFGHVQSTSCSDKITVTFPWCSCQEKARKRCAFRVSAIFSGVICPRLSDVVSAGKRS